MHDSSQLDQKYGSLWEALAFASFLSSFLHIRIHRLRDDTTCLDENEITFRTTSCGTSSRACSHKMHVTKLDHSTQKPLNFVSPCFADAGWDIVIGTKVNLEPSSAIVRSMTVRYADGTTQIRSQLGFPVRWVTFDKPILARTQNKTRTSSFIK